MIDVKYSKQKLIKQSCKDALLTSTLHGVLGIVKETNNLVKIIWFVCLLISITVCGYFVSSSLLYYLNYEVVTSLETIYEQQSEFPALSVCIAKPTNPNLHHYNYSCIFNSNSCSQQLEIFHDEVYKTSCIRFNSGSNKSNISYDVLNSTVGGINYGLYFDLNFRFHTSDFAEVAVFIHNKSFKSNYLYDKGFRLTSGSIYTVAIERTFDEKLEHPYNDCYKDINNFKLNKTILDFFEQINNSYTIVECIRFCRNLMILEHSNCNCIQSIDSSYKCSSSSNITIRNCYNDFTKRFQKSNIFDVCSKYCPYECDSINFSYTIFTTPLPASGFVTDSDFSKKYETYEELQKKFIRIIAYYPELRYTYINQDPKLLLADLVSNIGGTFGLFLGISFLSFIEVVELLIVVLRIIIKKY